MKLSTGQGKKIVIDTNIAISALIAEHGSPAKLFEKIILGEVQNYTTKEIILELQEVLSRKEITKRTTRNARNFILKQYTDNSVQVKTRTKINIVEHESDNKFIETAIEAKVSHIITGDSHLLKIKKFKGIKILAAKEFLNPQ